MDVSPLSTRYLRGEVNNAMQTLTGVWYSQVLQQCLICINVTTIRTKSDAILSLLITVIKLVKSRRTPQKQESCVIIMTPFIDFLSQRDPFSQDHALHCIATGVLADEEVNVDKCKEV